MATFEQQLAKCPKVSFGVISKELFDFIRTVADYLLELNKAQIRDNSEDIFGKPLGFYSKATDIITDGRKEWGTPFTGVDSGEFFDGFTLLIINNDVIWFYSNDAKTPEILASKAWLSHDLFGLTDDHLHEAIEEKLLPFIIEYSRKSIDL